MDKLTHLTEKQVVERIVSNPLPVLFVDTCNFGDIFRDALNGHGDKAIHTLAWLNDARTSQYFHLVLPAQVVNEFFSMTFVKLELQSLEKDISHWKSMLETYSQLKHLSNNPFEQNFDIQSARELYLSFFREIGNVFKHALILEPSEESTKWSHQRLRDCKRPAKQGKNSFGDCEICGGCVSLMRNLRESKFICEAYFVSANTDDYAFNKGLHEDLMEDFINVDMEYCATINQAYGQIRKGHGKVQRGQRQTSCATIDSDF